MEPYSPKAISLYGEIESCSRGSSWMASGAGIICRVKTEEGFIPSIQWSGQINLNPPQRAKVIKRFGKYTNRPKYFFAE